MFNVLLAVTDEDGYEPNTIFYPVQNEAASSRRVQDAFISGKFATTSKIFINKFTLS